MKIANESVICYVLFIFTLGFVCGTNIVYEDAKKAGVAKKINDKWSFVTEVSK